MLELRAPNARTERHKAIARQARPIGTSGAQISRDAGCVPVCALGRSLDIAVEDGESDVTGEIEREREREGGKGRGEAI